MHINWSLTENMLCIQRGVDWITDLNQVEEGLPAQFLYSANVQDQALDKATKDLKKPGKDHKVHWNAVRLNSL